jgi:hypothetical protein
LIRIGRSSGGCERCFTTSYDNGEGGGGGALSALTQGEDGEVGDDLDVLRPAEWAGNRRGQHHQRREVSGSRLGSCVLMSGCLRRTSTSVDSRVYLTDGGLPPLVQPRATRCVAFRQRRTPGVQYWTLWSSGAIRRNPVTSRCSRSHTAWYSAELCRIVSSSFHNDLMRASRRLAGSGTR